jgi:hypothetical protein
MSSIKLPKSAKEKAADMEKIKRVHWLLLEDEPLQLGDMQASEDPNTPEKQSDNGYNLQMQAVHISRFGIAANKFIGNYYRPWCILRKD